LNSYDYTFNVQRFLAAFLPTFLLSHGP
jgi:hypothetical protein